MKKINTLLAASVLAATAGVSAPVLADLSANAGFVTDYYYRGANLGGAGLYAGADYESGGFYAGVWAIDDGGTSVDDTGETSEGNDGLEYDLYLGYSTEVAGLSVTVGYTEYMYTYTSDSEGEVNLGLGLGAFSFDYADGEDKNAGGDTDYEFYSLSWSGEVFGAVVGTYENDGDEYDYAELSASGEVSGLDVTATLGSRDGTNDDGYLVLDVSKSFDL